MGARVKKRAGGAMKPIREYWPKHPSGHSGEKQRRNGEGEQEMLHHVGAEEIVVAQVVNRTIE